MGKAVGLRGPVATAPQGSTDRPSLPLLCVRRLVLPALSVAALPPLFPHPLPTLPPLASPPMHPSPLPALPPASEDLGAEMAQGTGFLPAPMWRRAEIPAPGCCPGQPWLRGIWGVTCSLKFAFLCAHCQINCLLGTLTLPTAPGITFSPTCRTPCPIPQ